MIFHYYALKYPDGRLVGLDKNSGGYPYPTEHISQAWIVEATKTNLQEIQDYQKTLQSYNFEIVRVKVDIMMSMMNRKA